MADIRDWVEEQEQALQMDRVAGGGEAIKLLEHSPTNRDITEKQGRLFTVSRFLSSATGIDIYKELPEELEKVQQNIDDVARHDYMKVSIEQWQGKTQVSKDKQNAARAMI